ncbi:MAG: VOC family protein [Chloroflexota bacterium]|nr:VOC family protein [Chloroflexota bacterium]
MSSAPHVGPIHHVAIIVRSIDAALSRYRELFGLLPEADPIDIASQGVRLCFLRTGPDPAARIELIEPLDDASGVARFLAARGEGLHHVCLATDDLPAELDRLAAYEVELIDRRARAGAHGPVGFLHPRTLSGVLWELVQPGENVNLDQEQSNP